MIVIKLEIHYHYWQLSVTFAFHVLLAVKLGCHLFFKPKSETFYEDFILNVCESMNGVLYNLFIRNYI